MSIFSVQDSLTSNMKPKTILSTHHIIPEVPHIRQMDDWDCGIACAAMIIGYCKGSSIPMPARRKSSREIRPRIWTIDLVSLLEKMDINYEFSTKFIGISDIHISNKNYKHIKEDAPRIERKFANAKDEGWNISQRTLSLQEILGYLHKNCPIIMLVDARKIFCNSCDSRITNLLRRASHFSGHYIVLIGYDDVDKLILYRDPSRTQGLCTMSYRCFEAARKSKECDADMIITSRNEVL